MGKCPHPLDNAVVRAEVAELDENDANAWVGDEADSSEAYLRRGVARCARVLSARSSNQCVAVAVILTIVMPTLLASPK